MSWRSLSISCVVGMAAAVLATPASAADLWGPREDGSLKDVPYERPFTWTGFYIGAQAGLGTGNTKGHPETISVLGAAPVAIPTTLASFFSTDYEMSGAIYGGHLGYNFQTGSLVVGIEGSFSGTSINGDGPAGIGLIVSERNVNWIGAVTGRLGYAMGRSLVYAKGGVAWGDVDANVRIGGITVLESNETHVGWTAGAGFEHALSNNVTVKIEYAHVDLGSSNHSLSYNGSLGGPAGAVVVGSNVDVKIDTVSLGVSYKF